jgi:hypothetical protein
MMNRQTNRNNDHNTTALEPGQIVVINAPKSSWHRKKAIVFNYHPGRNTASVHRFGGEKRTFSTKNLVEQYDDGGKVFAPGAGKPKVEHPEVPYQVNFDSGSIDDNHSFFSDGGDDLWSDDEKDYAELGREKKRSEQYRRERTNADGTEKSYHDLIIENRVLRKEIKRLQLSIRAVTNQLIADVNDKVNSFTAAAAP